MDVQIAIKTKEKNIQNNLNLVVKSAIIQKEKEIFMKIVKKKLPEKIKKQYISERGKKVKVLNSLYYGKDKKKNK